MSWPRRSRSRVSSSRSRTQLSGARPPLVWLKGEGNFTKAHRSPESLDKIVIHVTEGAFWGSVRWLQSPRAHASSHYVVARNGRIIQLVHLSDIAWHAGNWGTNEQSVGIEHEGFTYGPDGFTDAQYRLVRPARRLDRAALADADRPEAPDRPRRGAGRARRPRRLVAPHRSGPALELGSLPPPRPPLRRRRALSVKPLLPDGPLRGIVPWRAKASPDIGRRRVHRRRPRRPRRPAPPVRVPRSTRPGSRNRGYKLQVHGIAGPGRYDVDGARRPRRQQDLRAHERRRAAVDAGAEQDPAAGAAVGRRRRRRWCSRSTASGARSTVGPPFLFSWSTRRAKPGKHVLQVVATSIDGRVATRRIPLVVQAPPKPSRTAEAKARAGRRHRA